MVWSRELPNNLYEIYILINANVYVIVHVMLIFPYVS